VQTDNLYHVWVTSSSGGANARDITGRLRSTDVSFLLSCLDWIGDDNIVFSAAGSSQSTRLWIAAADGDGAGKRGIGAEGSYDAQPRACGDGSGIVFASYRTGSSHIWRSDLDGRNARQLTNGEGEFGPSCSPDGTWITYGSMDPKSAGVWRMPIDGGPAVRIWNEYGWSYISPDGKSVLVREYFAAENKIRIITAGGGQPVRTFEPDSELGVMRWSADGKSLLSVRTRNGVSNVWRRPLDGGDPRQVTRFESDQIGDFAESRDGKQLAVVRYSTASDVVMIRDLR